MTYGVLLMRELLADSWDIQALVSTAVSSLPHFFSLYNSTYFNPLCMHAIAITCGNSRP